MRSAWIHIVLVVLLVGACDSTIPQEPGTIVVESYQRERVGEVRLSRTVRFGNVPEAVLGARVELQFGGTSVAFESTETGGVYAAPADARVPESGDRFRLSVQYDNSEVSAEDLFPWPIALDSVSLVVPDLPVQAVLLDSLALPLDSLVSGSVAQLRYVYPIQATLWWSALDDDSDMWISTALDPGAALDSGVSDIFLRASAVREERELMSASGRSWKGVYAVAVQTEDTPLPAHDLHVHILRGSLNLAQFMLSRNDPDRREPVSNIVGGSGIAVGVASDSLIVRVQ